MIMVVLIVLFDFGKFMELKAVLKLKNKRDAVIRYITSIPLFFLTFYYFLKYTIFEENVSLGTQALFFGLSTSVFYDLNHFLWRKTVNSYLLFLFNFLNSNVSRTFLLYWLGVDVFCKVSGCTEGFCGSA